MRILKIEQMQKVDKGEIEGLGISFSEDVCAVLLDKELAKGLLPKRKRNSHKGSYGKAAIVGGSEEYTGAAYLAASACLRAGAGYTVLFVPKAILPLYALKSPELLLKPICEGGRYAFNEESMAELLSYDSIAFGMGMGASNEVLKGIEYLLKRYEGKLIIDADGLNSLAKLSLKDLEALFKDAKCDVILTPHCKEFSRLCRKAVEEIVEGGASSAKEFAGKYRVNLLLKNALSMITDGERLALNVAGNSGQAKGGSGDVLAGVIAGLCASGVNTFEGGALGAYLVGKAAELGVRDFSEYSLTASELIAYLPKAFLFVTEDTGEDREEQ